MSVIEVKNISKKYQITHQQDKYIALRDVLTNFIKNPLKSLKEMVKSNKEDFWALKDISFDVEQGETMGIIGANGAGKSTLLKIVSRITPPTSGEIKLRGKVASLLEVGTGFHAELTGRENVFLSGAILGMTKKEIVKKFDEIVEFSGIEKFIDTPVKRFSSGMYVRLAFSVAAHMDPDILLVDEVLAVGDAEFQKKCLAKMEEVTKKTGRTILFVSHNMAAIQNLCKRTLLLEKGEIKKIGETEGVIKEYLQGDLKREAFKVYKPNKNKQAQILKVVVKDEDNSITADLDFAKPFYIEVEYELRENIPGVYLRLSAYNPLFSKYMFVTSSNDNNSETPGKIGKYAARFKVDPFLNTGEYSFLIDLTTTQSSFIDRVMNPVVIRLQNRGKSPFPINEPSRDTIIVKSIPCKIERLLTNN